jgi:DNA-binding NtrC family response regulator
MQTIVLANKWLDLHVGLNWLLQKLLPIVSVSYGLALAVDECGKEVRAFSQIGVAPESSDPLRGVLPHIFELRKENNLRLGNVLWKHFAGNGGTHVYVALKHGKARGLAQKSGKIVELRQMCEMLLECSLMADMARRQGREVNFLGFSTAFRETYTKLRRVAALDGTPVFLMGERGAGKEAAAFAIHYFSRRRDRPFVAINCAALTPELFAAELFGHRKGSFTGAVSDRAGLFHAADGGTLFLDEITEAPRSMYAGLLRVLDCGDVQRIGDNLPNKVDVRIIAATNRDMARLISGQAFPVDLYDRLNVLPIRVPALRERSVDVPLLANYFLAANCPRRRSCTTESGCGPCLGRELAQALCNYDWPGNVRELRNFIFQLIAEDDNRPFSASALNISTEGKRNDGSLEQAIREYIVLALKRSGWNRSAAARSLGLPLSTLISKMKKLHIVETPAELPSKFDPTA